METRANHVLIGAFTLAVLVFGLMFVMWAAKYSTDQQWDEYRVVFREAVTGLSVGSVVQYNGIGVGEVQDLRLDPRDPSRVLADIRVRSGTPVKTDTSAKLAFVGLTGVAMIQLTGGKPESPMLNEASDRDRPVIVADVSAIQRLLESSEDIVTTASDVVLRINRLLSDENMERISRTIAHIEQVSGTVAGQREDIRQLIVSARESSQRLERTLATAETTMQRVDSSVATIDASLVQKLPELVTRLDATLVQIEALSRTANRTLESNADAIDSFGNQGLTQVGPALAELRAVLRELDRITSQIEDNPAAFVLGRGKPEEFDP
jgi:phospholipid/cholesterol/gamma-HCH transport system substrate-binding protein